MYYAKSWVRFPNSAYPVLQSHLCCLVLSGKPLRKERTDMLSKCLNTSTKNGTQIFVNENPACIISQTFPIIRFVHLAPFLRVMMSPIAGNTGRRCLHALHLDWIIREEVWGIQFIFNNMNLNHLIPISLWSRNLRSWIFLNL